MVANSILAYTANNLCRFAVLQIGTFPPSMEEYTSNYCCQIHIKLLQITIKLIIKLYRMKKQQGLLLKKTDRSVSLLTATNLLCHGFPTYITVVISAYSLLTTGLHVVTA